MTQNECYCQCGCGAKTQIAKRNDKRYGDVAGKHHRFLKGHHSKKAKVFTKHGYVKIKKPEHPRADTNGYVYEHILVMEELLKRPILITEAIHHINGKGTDNTPGNLMLFKTNAMHSSYHKRIRAFNASGNWNWWICKYCHIYDDPINMTKDGTAAYHKDCKNLRRRIVSQQAT